MKLIGYHILFILLITAVNTSVPSYFNGRSGSFDLKNQWKNEHAAEAVRLRQSGEFYRRPIMYSIQNVLKTAGIPEQFSFLLVSLMALGLSGVLFVKWANVMTDSPSPGIWALTAYYLNFSILFGYFPIIMTYDEPIQYVFILAGLLILFRYGLWSSLPCWILAVITRETTFLLLPIIFYPIIKSSRIQKLVFIFSVFLIYSIYLWVYVPAEILKENMDFLFSNRLYGWKENFMNISWTFKSLGSLFLTLGLPCYILWKFRQSADPVEGKMLKTWNRILIPILVFNTLLVLISGRARESRLFFLPLLLLLPLLISYLEMQKPALKEFLLKYSSRLKILVAAIPVLVILMVFMIKSRYTIYYASYSLIYLMAFGFFIGFFDQKKVQPNQQ